MTKQTIEGFEFTLYCAFCPDSVSAPLLPDAFKALTEHYVEDHLVQYEEEACPDCMPLRGEPA